MNKIIEICKKVGKFIVYDNKTDQKWIGNGEIMCPYESQNYSSAYFTALTKLKPEEVIKTIFETVPFPDNIDITEFSEFEKPIEISKIAIIVEDEKLIPLLTQNGVTYIKYDYLEVVKNEEFNIYERKDNDGKSYFVIKSGFIVSAVIFPDNSYIDDATLFNLEKIVNAHKKRMENFNSDKMVR